jgi:hypothetical protein
MKSDNTIQARHSLARRVLFPFYRKDQIVLAVSLESMAVLGSSLVGLSDVVFAASVIGAYIGMAYTQWVYAPHQMFVPLKDRETVRAFLDASPLLRRGERPDEWMPTRSRWRRWDCETIGLAPVPDGFRVTGIRRDLAIIRRHVEQAADRRSA